MKNLMNRLGMVAVALALGVAGYLVVSHFSVKKYDNVKVQLAKPKIASGQPCDSLAPDAGCQSGACDQTTNTCKKQD